MRTIVVLEDFEAYPASKRRVFTKGAEVEVSEEFADLVVGKGHAREAEPASAKKRESKS